MGLAETCFGELNSCCNFNLPNHNSGMKSQGADKRILVLHYNSGISCAVDEVVLCNNEGGKMPGLGPSNPELVLQDCKLMGDSYVLICRDLKEEDRLRGVPTIVATSYRSANISPATLLVEVPQQEIPDMQKIILMINNLLSIFGFTYLVMNRERKAAK